MLYFAKSYTASINDRIVLGRNISNATLQLSDVQIWLDMSSKFENLFIANQSHEHWIAPTPREGLEFLFFLNPVLVLVQKIS